MNQVFTLYTVFFIVTTLVSFCVAFLAFERRSVTGARELAWLMMAIGTSTFWIIFETAPTMAEKIFWSKLEYAGGATTPVLYLIFVLRFTGQDKLLSLRNIILLFIIPAITFTLALTNEDHYLLWSGFSPISARTNLMEYYHGIWFWTGFTAYSYLLMLLATVFLVSFIMHHSKMFRAQALIVLAGGLFPWIVSVIYITGSSPVPGLDLTPFSMTLSGVMACYAILYFRFLDLVPVARETLLEILPDGILALDSLNRIQDINGAALSFLGIRNKNIIGFPAASSGASSTLLLNAAIAQDPADQVEIADCGRIKIFKIFRQSIKRQPGSSLIIIRDITQRMQAEQELIKAKEHAEESDRLKSAFLANMSHEIRTPMNGILGFTELLKMEDITGKQQNEYLEIIRKSGQRMLGIINDIIDISKIESGQMKVLISEININEQIDSISSFFKPEAESKGIQIFFKTKFEGKDAVLKTDPDKIYAILTNLVKNAIKFTHSGFIELGYMRKDKFLEFFVKDTGVGINSQQKDLIFERFRQGSDSLTRNYEGTGLGLSISKAYVEMLGGKIWFESEYGKGSVFSFNIPCNSQQTEKFITSDAFHEKPIIKKIRRLVILIVDDDKPSELLINQLVSPFSKRILTACTGNEAIEVCRANPDIDLVLMDIKLPQMDGYEATHRIRQFNMDLIIIAQTAFGLIGDREKALEAGCTDYISKPIEKNVLIGLIQKYFSNQD